MTTKIFGLSVTAMVLAVAGLSASCDDGAAPTSQGHAQRHSIGQCTRDQVEIHGPPITCVNDPDCPCGMYCDGALHVCAYDCNLPPANVEESCPVDSQCDDTGRCVGPGVPAPAPAGVLSANPASLTTVPGGPAKTFQAKLRVAADNAATRSTRMRVVGRDGAQVSCDATTFGGECLLTGWTFSVALDGPSFVGAKNVFVRTAAGTEEGHGDVLLRVDATQGEFVVPTGAQQPTIDGFYAGVAVSADYPERIPVRALIDTDQMTLVLRDPTRALAPDGTLLLNFRTDGGNNGEPRKLVWLRGVGAPAAAGAIVGRYGATGSTLKPDGTVEVPFTIAVPGRSVANWTLLLTRSLPFEPECRTASDCAAGEVCPFEQEEDAVKVCVPAIVWDPPTTPPGNQLDDARSVQWWSALSGQVTTTDPNHAFSHTGPDLVEALMCTTSDTAAGAGYLGKLQVRQGTGPSLSGDLACVGGNGAPNLASGAVGLVTHRDRIPSPAGAADPNASSALLQTCLQDLGRPVTGVFAQNFGPSVGNCVNLARFLPAIRLLATGEAGKVRRPLEARSRGLFVRLIQEWAVLHGFLASTGLAAREFDDAVAATAEQARSGLLGLLDTLDAGWGALLDKRIAAEVALAANPAYVDALGSDYRALKQPVVYWPFNAGAPRFDVVRNVELVAAPGQPWFCNPDDIRSTGQNLYMQERWPCSGWSAALPAGAPDVRGENGSLSMVVNVDQLDAIAGFGVPYWGGTLIATPTLAFGEYVAGGNRWLVAVHPTANGGVEFVTVTNYGRLGPFNVLVHVTAPFVGSRGTSVGLVRDAVSRTYTFYIWDAENRPGLQVTTLPYINPVQGQLGWMSGRGPVVVGAAPWVPRDDDSDDPWIAWGNLSSSYIGAIDDVAIFNRTLSRREFVDFASQRGAPTWVPNGRFISPQPLAAHGTQEIDAPLGAQLLEAQASHLDVVGRLLEHMKYEAQVACESAGAQSARADIEAIVARAGRTLRQSQLVEAMAAEDPSARAGKARQLLHAKRGRILRGLQPLITCSNPFGMAENEVPLYHNSISPQVSETDAFFAASDHLLGLAQDRVDDATDALSDVRNAWEQARQSQIQQLQTNDGRTKRVEELNKQYGDLLLRLCGIDDQTPEAILATVNAGQFSLDNCFVKPSCRAQHSPANILETDGACYRGILGASLMEMRAAYRGQQTAYQNWRTAIADANAAARICILKEMDARGCTALDRHALSGVECPPEFQGTEELVASFHDNERDESDEDRLLTVGSGAAAGALAGASAGPWGAVAGAVIGGFSAFIGSSVQGGKEERQAGHQEVLLKHANDAAIRECWVQAEHPQRAIAAAEESWLQATAQFSAATIAFANAGAQGRQTVLEAPVVIDRELVRPSMPIAFHYWLPEKIETYRTAMDRARRYVYLALRAVEYDKLDRYVAPSAVRPARSAVLSAWRPMELQEQIDRLHERTDTRTTESGPPSLGHMAFDAGARFFGLAEGAATFGAELDARVRPVFSTNGVYLGKGLRFTLLPKVASDAPVFRCAERIWRVNVGVSGLPSPRAPEHHLKLIKRNQFASRTCDEAGFQVSSHRPEADLFVDAGEETNLPPPETQSVADLSVVNLDVPNALLEFRESDSFLNGSSAELSLQGLYGDYVLLFPVPALEHGMDLNDLRDLNLRFDFLSVDNLPPAPLNPNLLESAAAAQPTIAIDTDLTPIVVE